MAEHHMCILKGAKVYFYQEYGKKVKLPDAFNRAKAQEEAKRFVDAFASKYTFGYLKDIAGDYEEILKDNLDDKEMLFSERKTFLADKLPIEERRARCLQMFKEHLKSRDEAK